MEKKTIKTFIFMDIETTGLPFYESNKTKITELCLSAVLKDHIELGVFPRVRNTLNLCFNPRKLIDAEAEKITGLSNFLLEHQSEFQDDTFEIILKYMEIHPKPICLVAHNGFKFDYPIFKAEISKIHKSLPEDIVCIDSLETFKYLLCDYKSSAENSPSPEYAKPVTATEIKTNLELPESSGIQDISHVQLINETTPKAKKMKNDEMFLKPGDLKQPFGTAREHCSEVRKTLFAEERNLKKFDLNLKLGNIYYYLKKEQPKDTHRAEGDVNVLIEIAAIFGEKFVDWAENNATNFCDVPKMERGKKIGT